MTKPQLAIILFPETSALNATFPLARALAKAGIEPLFITVNHYREYVEKHGFTCVLMDPFPEQQGSARAIASARYTFYRDNLARICDHHNFIGLLLDPLLWTMAGPFLARKIPIIGLNTTLASVYNPEVPPVFSPLLPSKTSTWFARLTRGFLNRWSWLKLATINASNNNNVTLPRLWLSPFMGDFPWLEVKRALQAQGAQIRWGEYGYRLVTPEVVLAPACFDFPNLARQSTRCYVGACVATWRHDGFHPNQSTEMDPDANAEQDQRPLIYCSIGSYSTLCQGRMAFFATVIEAFRQRPDLRLVIQFPDDASSLEPIPNNVTVMSWAPQLTLLSKAALFITHGGPSSIRESLYFGVPMLAFPFFNDGYGNGARIEYHQLGKMGSMEHVTPPQFLQLMDEVLGNPTYKQRVATFQRELREQMDCGEAVTFIRQHLSPTKSPPAPDANP